MGLWLKILMKSQAMLNDLYIRAVLTCDWLLLHKYQCHTLLIALICFNGKKSHVLIRDARDVNARPSLMFVTRHQAKHVLKIMSI